MPQGRRTRTTLATQALFLLNSPFVVAQSEVIAGRLARSHDGPEARVEAAYELILNRKPTPTERELALSYIQGSSDGQIWATFIQSLLASVDFRSLH